MPLTGAAKVAYQREYMRRRRAKANVATSQHLTLGAAAKAKGVDVSTIRNAIRSGRLMARRVAHVRGVAYQIAVENLAEFHPVQHREARPAKRLCASCGVPFTSGHASARYCSQTHQKNSTRDRRRAAARARKGRAP